ALLRARHADPQAVQAERVEHPLVDHLAEVGARDPLDELGEHPVGRAGVVLEAGAGLPVEAPLGEPLQSLLTRRPVGRAEGSSPASTSRRARVTRSSSVMARTVDPLTPFLTGRQVGAIVAEQSRERGSMTDDLHRGTYMADLLLHALESNLDKPCVYLGGQ